MIIYYPEMQLSAGKVKTNILVFRIPYCKPSL